VRVINVDNLLLQKTRPYLFPVNPVVGPVAVETVYIPKGYFYHLNEVRVISDPTNFNVSVKLNAVSKALQSMTNFVDVDLISSQSEKATQIKSVKDIDLMLCDADVVQINISGNTGGMKICLVGNLIPVGSKMGEL
jgi:hypothetical protein